MSPSPMLHVEFKKCPCHPVDFRGLGPYACTGNIVNMQLLNIPPIVIDVITMYYHYDLQSIGCCRRTYISLFNFDSGVVGSQNYFQF